MSHITCSYALRQRWHQLARLPAYCCTNAVTVGMLLSPRLRGVAEWGRADRARSTMKTAKWTDCSTTSKRGFPSRHGAAGGYKRKRTIQND